MGNAQQERNAISKFLDDSDLKNLLQDARLSMEMLEQHARWLNEDRFVMYARSFVKHILYFNHDFCNYKIVSVGVIYFVSIIILFCFGVH